jgi:membrane-associated phospholipid phosphatase
MSPKIGPEIGPKSFPNLEEHLSLCQRPVSVLPVLSQVFERVLQGRLLEFLDHQKVITPGQYGFRSGHSTAMAVVDISLRI